MHRCPNRACPSRGLETLNNWVMAAADIEGVGEQLVGRLWELGLLRSLPDLYRLTKEQLLELDGFQETSATNVVDAIAASRTLPLGRVLFGLNIPDVGWVTGQAAGAPFRHDRASGAPPRRRRSWPATASGPSAPRRSSNGSRTTPTRRSSPSSGRSLDVQEEEPAPEGRLTGSTYVITGTLESLTREEASAALEALGAKIASSVSKKTTGLIVGEEPGASKVRGAEKHGTPVLDEDEPEGATRRPELAANRSCARRAESVLTGRPLFMHRERVAAAHVAGERRGRARRAGLGHDVAARRGSPEPVGERPGDARDRRGCR